MQSMNDPKANLPMRALEDLCRRYQIRELALFGSVLTERFGQESDVDLLVEFEPQAAVGLLKLARIQRELSTLLKRNVDLIPKGGLKPRIRQSVLSSAKVIYAA